VIHSDRMQEMQPYRRSANHTERKSSARNASRASIDDTTRGCLPGEDKLDGSCSQAIAREAERRNDSNLCMAQSTVAMPDSTALQLSCPQARV